MAGTHAGFATTQLWYICKERGPNYPEFGETTQGSAKLNLTHTRQQHMSQFVVIAMCTCEGIPMRKPR